MERTVQLMPTHLQDTFYFFRPWCYSSALWTLTLKLQRQRAERHQQATATQAVVGDNTNL